MTDNRLTDIEIALSNQERMMDDLNTEVLRLSRLVNVLIKKIETLEARSEEALVKPLAEEVPPPHY